MANNQLKIEKVAEYLVQDVHSTRGYFAFADEKGSMTSIMSNKSLKSRPKPVISQQEFEIPVDNHEVPISSRPFLNSG